MLLVTIYAFALGIARRWSSAWQFRTLPRACRPALAGLTVNCRSVSRSWRRNLVTCDIVLNSPNPLCGNPTKEAIRSRPNAWPGRDRAPDARRAFFALFSARASGLHTYMPITLIATCVVACGPLFFTPPSALGSARRQCAADDRTADRSDMRTVRLSLRYRHRCRCSFRATRVQVPMAAWPRGRVLSLSSRIMPRRPSWSRASRSRNASAWCARGRSLLAMKELKRSILAPAIAA